LVQHDCTLIHEVVEFSLEVQLGLFEVGKLIEKLRMNRLLQPFNSGDDFVLDLNSLNLDIVIDVNDFIQRFSQEGNLGWQCLLKVAGNVF